MSLFSKFKEGLAKTSSKLTSEIKRIITRSPKMTTDVLEELEYALISSDLGMTMTQQIIDAVRESFESQGKDAVDVNTIAREQMLKSFRQKQYPLEKNPNGLTVVSVIGVNGSGKTTTCAKLAHRIQMEGGTAMLAACDTFRAAAIEQLTLWGNRLSTPVIAGEYGADPAAVAHDAVQSALSKSTDFLFIDTAGRLHTKKNLMQELQKIHRVIKKQIPEAPHEVLLVVDGSTGMNAMNQAVEFNKIAPITGLVVTKLDGTSKGGMLLAIHNELDIPVKFVGLGEKPDDLQPFHAEEFAMALFPPQKAELDVK